MKNFKLPILVVLIAVLIVLRPAAGTKAESQDHFGENIKVFLDVKVKCYDHKRKELVWEFSNLADKKSDGVRWIIGMKSGSEAVLLPGEKRLVTTPLGELLELYFENGSFMGSEEVPTMVFWCLFP